MVYDVVCPKSCAEMFWLKICGARMIPQFFHERIRRTAESYCVQKVYHVHFVLFSSRFFDSRATPFVVVAARSSVNQLLRRGKKRPSCWPTSIPNRMTS